MDSLPTTVIDEFISTVKKIQQFVADGSLRSVMDQPAWDPLFDNDTPRKAYFEFLEVRCVLTVLFASAAAMHDTQ